MENKTNKRPLEESLTDPNEEEVERPRKSARTMNVSKDVESVPKSPGSEELPEPKVKLDPNLFDTKNETSPIFVHHVSKAGEQKIFPLFVDSEEYADSCVRTGGLFSIKIAREYDITTGKQPHRCYGCVFIERWKAYWERKRQWIYDDLNAIGGSYKAFLEAWETVPDLKAEEIFPTIQTGGLKYIQDCAMNGLAFDEATARNHDKAINVEYEANDLPYWCYTCDYHEACACRAKKRYQAMDKACQKFENRSDDDD